MLWDCSTNIVIRGGAWVWGEKEGKTSRFLSNAVDAVLEAIVGVVVGSWLWQVSLILCGKIKKNNISLLIVLLQFIGSASSYRLDHGQQSFSSIFYIHLNFGAPDFLGLWVSFLTTFWLSFVRAFDSILRYDDLFLTFIFFTSTFFSDFWTLLMAPLNTFLLD